MLYFLNISVNLENKYEFGSETLSGSVNYNYDSGSRKPINDGFTESISGSTTLI
jgi:hypothetical protein